MFCPSSNDCDAFALLPMWRTGSRLKRQLARDSNGNWPATPDEIAQARQFTTSLLNDPAVSVPEAVVIDVGVISGKGWAVVEANAAFGSGMYGCDPTQVLQVLATASGIKREINIPWEHQHPAGN
ncbi:MAG: ATP-grasp domain-containing protein [Acidobacteria bacterium]|nr:ATP-grasp domain-containing protein [Acidobacteriota bacterium]